MNDHQFRAGPFVCASCLEDEALQRFANEHGDTRQCDYCGNTPTSLSVVPLDDVTEFMARAIAEEWCDPVQTAPHCSAEGGYQVETLENHELFERIGFEVSNDRLMDDLLEAFADHDWCEVNWQILSPSKRWGAAWRRFERVIKHERRYTFWYSDDDDESPTHPDHLPPSQMLNELQAVINNTGLVNQLPVGTPMWRVRCHDHGGVAEDANNILAVLCTKHPAWQYEAEWRVIAPLAGAIRYKLTKGDGDRFCVPFEPRNLRRVIFGMRMSTENQKRLLAVLAMPEYKHVGQETTAVEPHTGELILGSIESKH